MDMFEKIILGVFLLMNLTSFLTFGYDKRRAIAGDRRISEARLVGTTLFLGIIGGWVGMSVFRHKTQKVSFQLKMIAATILNAVWVWIYFRWKA